MVAPCADADPAMDATAIIYKPGSGRHLMVFNHDAGRFRFCEIAR
ncbi:hypothetical protein [Pelagibacterium sediminicola]|nr:hypothetical protein [Pelagibacterium sediminicola]